MFQLEIAFLLELALFAAGLVLLQLGRQWTAPLVRAAAAVLLLGSVLTAACSAYFGVRYHVQGEFDYAYPAHHGRAMPPGAMHWCMQEEAQRMLGEPMPARPGAETRLPPAETAPEAHHLAAEGHGAER